MSSSDRGGGGGGRRPAAERSTTTLILLTTAAVVVAAATALAFYNSSKAATAAIKDSETTETLTSDEAASRAAAAVTNNGKEDGQFQDMNRPVEEEEEEDEELVKVMQPQQQQTPEIDSASAAADSSKNSISPVTPSGAKNEKAALVTPTTPTPYCWHGSLPRTEENVQGMKRAEALRELLHALQITVKAGLPFSATMKTFVTEPEIRPLVDEHLIQCVLAHATDEILQGHAGDVRMARLFVSISMALEAAVGRIDEFAQVLEQTLNGGQQQQNDATTPEWYQTWNSKSVNIVSEKDIILYLQERIPCNCLDEKVRQIQATASSSFAASSSTPRAAAAANVSSSDSSKMMSCLKCGKRDLESKLFICGQCKIVRYCSKDCQWQDWKEHRKVCSAASASAITTTTTKKQQQPGE